MDRFSFLSSLVIQSVAGQQPIFYEQVSFAALGSSLEAIGAIGGEGRCHARRAGLYTEWARPISYVSQTGRVKHGMRQIRPGRSRMDI